MMKFKGFQKLSLIEWPDKICAVVFVGGCNFRCPWCYNQDLAWQPEKLPDINEQEILEYLRKNKKFLEGVMITGGEPLITPKNQLIDFIKKIKRIGLEVGVETNGSNPEAIEYLLDNKLVDYIAMDIKAPLEPEKYNQLVGAKVDLDKIRTSIKIIIEKAPDSEFRTTIVPDLLTAKDMIKIAELIKGVKRYYLQQFSARLPGQGRRKKKWSAKPYSQQFLENLRAKIRNYFKICEIRS